MIEVGSKWQHKDGEIYEVVDGQADACYYQRGIYGQQMMEGVVYKNKVGEVYIRTKKHFLQSFKPYEYITEEYYKNDSEFIESVIASEYQRLDFTKQIANVP